MMSLLFAGLDRLILLMGNSALTHFTCNLNYVILMKHTNVTALWFAETFSTFYFGDWAVETSIPL